MTSLIPSTRDRLVLNAALLFRQKGYHGVGVAEILARAKAPKGSLYHHFPNGKADLALAAADWASAQMQRVAADAFEPAKSFDAGATTFCFKLAKLFDLSDHWDGCPVSSTLFEGPQNQAFREKAASVFSGWIDQIAEYGRAAGLPRDIARDRAEALFIGLEGAWVLARALKTSDPIKRLPRLLGFAPGSGPG